MEKPFKCVFCENSILNEDELFILKEDIEDWDCKNHRTKIIRAGKTCCVECLIDYIEDTERVPATLPQIEYRYIGVKDA